MHRDKDYIGYELPKWSPDNHLSYVDDTILFSSGDKGSIIKVMNILNRYERVSGQLINKSKSVHYLYDSTLLIYEIKLRKLTGIRQGDFTFMYLDALSTMEEREMSILKISSEKYPEELDIDRTNF